MMLSAAQWIVVAAAVVGGSYHQRWGKLTDGAVAYTAGNETYLRGFDPQTLSLTPAQQVNQTTLLQQDECEAIRLAGGNVVVLWSDRSGLLSEYMSAMGRVYSPQLTPLTGELKLSTDPDTSWRPLGCALPDGGWAASWAEAWNEESVWRAFDADGTPRGPSHRMHSASGGSQNSGDVAPFRGRLAWIYVEAANTPSPRDVVMGASSISGAILRSWQLTQPGTSWEARVDSNGDSAVFVWMQPDANDVWSRPWGGAPQLLGAGRDPEVALRSNRGLAVWDHGGSIMLAELSANGAALDVFELVSGLAPTPSQELGRRQCDVELDPAGDVAWVSYGFWNGADMDTAIVRIERQP